MLLGGLLRSVVRLGVALWACYFLLNAVHSRFRGRELPLDRHLAIFFWMLSASSVLGATRKRYVLLAIFFWMLSTLFPHIMPASMPASSLLFSFECCSKGSAKHFTATRHRCSCYFLLNAVWHGLSKLRHWPYAQENLLFSFKCCFCWCWHSIRFEEDELAIFFWMLSLGVASTSSVFVVVPCYFLLNAVSEQ